MLGFESEGGGTQKMKEKISHVEPLLKKVEKKMKAAALIDELTQYIFSKR